MKDMIAYCGLDCETCDAYIATMTDDDVLREKTANAWSEMNGASITPDMINCEGCRMDGVKTHFCNSICPIRQCARGKKFSTCGDCPDMEICEKIGTVHKSAPCQRTADRAAYIKAEIKYEIMILNGSPKRERLYAHYPLFSGGHGQHIKK